MLISPFSVLSYADGFSGGARLSIFISSNDLLELSESLDLNLIIFNETVFLNSCLILLIKLYILVRKLKHVNHSLHLVTDAARIRSPVCIHRAGE